MDKHDEPLDAGDFQRELFTYFLRKITRKKLLLLFLSDRKGSRSIRERLVPSTSSFAAQATPSGTQCFVFLYTTGSNLIPAPFPHCNFLTLADYVI